MRKKGRSSGPDARCRAWEVSQNCGRCPDWGKEGVCVRDSSCGLATEEHGKSRTSLIGSAGASDLSAMPIGGIRR